MTRCTYKEGTTECHLAAAKRSKKGWCNKHMKRKGFDRKRAPGKKKRWDLDKYVPQLLADSDGFCDLCGRKIHARHDIEVEHAHARKNGGSNLYDNLLVAHALCNMVKCYTLITDPELWKRIGQIKYTDHYKDGESKRRIPAAVKKSAVKMYEKGIHPPQIAEELGISKSTVNRIILRAGVHKRSMKEARGGKTPHEETVICALYKNGQKTELIAKKMNTSAANVLHIVRRHKIRVIPQKERVGGVSDAVEKRACRLYMQGMTMYEVADEIGKSQGCVKGILHRRKIERRPGGHPPALTGEKEKLAIRLYEEGVSMTAIAKELGLGENHHYISRLLTKNGIKIRTHKVEELPSKDKAYIVRAYENGEKSTIELGKMFGFGKAAINQFLVEQGVTIYSPSKARKLMYKRNPLLSTKQKKAVISFYKKEYTLKQIARYFGVGTNTIRELVLAAGIMRSKSEALSLPSKPEIRKTK